MEHSGMTDHPYPRERTWPDCEAEIDRLRRDHEKDWADAQLKAAEIERLRGLLRDALVEYPFNNPAEAAAFNEIKRLWGQRVRAALGDG